jgi:hypothetical protein
MASDAGSTVNMAENSRALIDLTGLVFEDLTVIGRDAARGNRPVYWVCRCSCGVQCSVCGQLLREGRKTSCGCKWKKEKHGDSESPEYYAWCYMKTRALNPNIRCAKNYSARGITVCDRWRDSYEAFLADMGRKPSPKHSLDRYPNNDGNYEPGNCRWATASEQAKNTRKAKRAEAGK